MLPGKYCIGILEEDNPLKSYFRLKPLLVEVNGKYQFFDGRETYPENGCIRIVPDKNESSHFKARMRRMGRYCVLDLREHSGENDKIRPNKNYSNDEGEHNAHIVYSDVVREPAPDMIFEISDFEGENWQEAMPGTPRFLRGDSLETWHFPEVEEGETPVPEKDGLSLMEEELQRVEIPGFDDSPLRLALRLPAHMPDVVASPEKREVPAPRREELPPPEPVKPWISRDPAPFAAQSANSQTGLNPRRSRSLQEIIEEKWRHSRVDQLGHPIPVHAMGRPVADPVEQVMEALRNAWSKPEIHGQLMEALTAMPDLVCDFRAHSKAAADIVRQRELEDLEAERLRTLGDLDRLRRDKAKLRETFRQEIRQEEAEAFRDAVERTKTAQAECRKFEAYAEEARLGAEMAQDAFAALTDGRFEEKLRDFALTSRAAELLSHTPEAPAPLPAAPCPAPDRAEWFRRLKLSFAREGIAIDDVQAANLLVCAALGEKLIFSGAAASDKLAYARALARAIDGDGEKDGCVHLLPCANDEERADLFRGLGSCCERVFAVASDSGAALSAESLEQSFLLRVCPPAADSPWRPMQADGGELTPQTVAALRRAFTAADADLPPALERRLSGIRSALSMNGVRLSRRTLDLMWNYCASMLDLAKVSPAEALDMAFAQKALPCILAEARVECLANLKNILAELPRSQALLDYPLPITI